MNARRLPGHPVAADQEKQADDEEQHQGADLHEGEPELHLAEPLDRDHVHGAHEGQGAERENPLRHIGEGAPVAHVERDGGDIDDPGHRPVEVVHPPGNERSALAQELARIGDEAAGRRAIHHQLAQRAQDQEREHATGEIDDGKSRSCQLQPGACTEEQAGADGAADGDHLDLPGLQAFLVSLLMGIEPVLLVESRRAANRTLLAGDVHENPPSWLDGRGETDDGHEQGGTARCRRCQTLIST